MRESQKALRSIDQHDMQNALEHLREKYSDEDFEPESIITPSVDISYIEYFFTNKKYPKEHIRVIQTKDDSYSDDYYGILKHSEYTNILESFIKESIGDAKVFVRYAGRGFPEMLTDAIPLSAALLHEGELFYSFVFVFTADCTAAQKTEEICRRLKENGLPNSISIYTVNEEIYSETTSDNYREQIIKYKLAPAAVGEAAL